MTSHYIEFGVVLGMLLPLAVHQAMFAKSKWLRRWRWGIVGLLACAIPFSISRSGALAMAVGLLILSLAWPWRLRLQAAVLAAVSLIAFRIVQPGVLGTIKSLFLRAEDDPSVQNRIADYDRVYAFIDQRPWLGRGAGTFMPEQYILLDNQLLLTWVSAGVVGLAALVALFVGFFATARSIRLRGADEETRHLGQAFASAVGVAVIASATFDSLSFATFSCTVFLIFGLTGALWRIDGAGRDRVLAVDDGRGRLAPSWLSLVVRGALK